MNSVRPNHRRHIQCFYYGIDKTNDQHQVLALSLFRAPPLLKSPLLIVLFSFVRRQNVRNVRSTVRSILGHRIGHTYYSVHSNLYI